MRLGKEVAVWRPVCDGTYLSSLCVYLPFAVLFLYNFLYIMNYNLPNHVKLIRGGTRCQE